MIRGRDHDNRPHSAIRSPQATGNHPGAAPIRGSRTKPTKIKMHRRRRRPGLVRPAPSVERDIGHIKCDRQQGSTAHDDQVADTAIVARRATPTVSPAPGTQAPWPPARCGPASVFRSSITAPGPQDKLGERTRRNEEQKQQRHHALGQTSTSARRQGKDLHAPMRQAITNPKSPRMAGKTAHWRNGPTFFGSFGGGGK